jgi:sugar lactone lactonase YvrE
MAEEESIGDRKDRSRTQAEPNMQRTVSTAGVVGVLLLAPLIGVGPLACRHAPDDAKAPRSIIEPAWYPEGPAYVDGKLYFAEYGKDRVRVWDGAKTETLWDRKGSGPASVLPLEKGELLIACYDNNTLVRINAAGKTLETIDLLELDPGAKGPNDFAQDAKGGVYFSTSGDPKTSFSKDAPVEGRVYYLPPGGKPSLVAKGIHYANGLALIEGGKTLLVNEHLAHQVLKFTVDARGDLSGRDVWKRLADLEADPASPDWYTGPDGLKADAAGNVYICQFGAGRILVADSKGARVRTIKLPYKYVTNVAFGPRGKVLYVTAAKDAWKAPYPGAVFEVPND